jgi:uncharacterized protein (TIGR02246 family)
MSRSQARTVFGSNPRSATSYPTPESESSRQLGSSQEGPMTVPQSDEEAISAETQRFAEAWSRGDAKAAVAFFADDGVRVGAMGDTQRGRAEIEAAFERLFHGPFAGASVHLQPGTVRMLTADLALWQGAIEITPAEGAPMNGHVVQLMKMVEGRWLVLESHPKLFPTPPAARP